MALTQLDIDGRNGANESQPDIQVSTDSRSIKMILKKSKVIPVALALLGVTGFTVRDEFPTVVKASWVEKVDKHIDSSDRWRDEFTLRFLQQCRWEAQRNDDQRRVEELNDEIKKLELRMVK